MMRVLSGALDKNHPTPDYLEATVYNKEEAVIMVGNFADVPYNEQHKVREFMCQKYLYLLVSIT